MVFCGWNNVCLDMNMLAKPAKRHIHTAKVSHKYAYVCVFKSENDDKANQQQSQTKK